MTLTDEERGQLELWARRPKTSQRLALRSRIVLACAKGMDNTEVADELGVSNVTVGKWRKRFLLTRLDGLSDEPRPGAPRKITDDVHRVVTRTLGNETEKRHTPEHPIDGQGDRDDPERRVEDLASVWASTAPYQDVQDL